MTDPTPAQKLNEEILRECEKLNNDHITHFHDCGCLSQKYKEVIKDLLEASEHALEFLQYHNYSIQAKPLEKAIQKAQELQPRGE